MKHIVLAILTLFILAGCSAKEFSDGAEGIVNDISNAFNSSKDDSN